MLPTAFLAFAVLGLVLTANAWRPLQWTYFAVPVFFAGWLTAELAVHHLAIHVVAAAAFVAAGALEGWQGWTALGISAVTAIGLGGLVLQGHRAGEVVERALCAGLGEGYVQEISGARDPDYDLGVAWRQIMLPFHMRHREVERIADVAYGPYGRRNRLDVYRPRSGGSGRRPVVLQVHGGAWTIGNKSQQGRPLMLHMASRGWICFAINYRLSRRATWPDHIVDVKRALAWIREHGAEYGADPNFVVITGGSAGGHLAALAALTPGVGEFQPGFEDADTSVQACVPYYGVYDLTDTAELRIARDRLRFLERVVFKRRFGDDPAAFEAASPIRRVGPEAPPFLVIHGVHDSLVPVSEAREFVDRLRSVSPSRVCYVELPGAQHAFDVFPSLRTAHVVKAVERFADYAYCRALAPRGAGDERPS